MESPVRPQDQSSPNSRPQQQIGGRRQHSTPKILAKACLACRTRKIRCDAKRPHCSSCVSQSRTCKYAIEAPRKRPTFAEIADLQGEIKRLSAFIMSLKESSPEERNVLLERVAIDGVNGERLVDRHAENESRTDRTADTDQDVHSSRGSHRTRSSVNDATHPDAGESSTDEELEPDLSLYACVDDAGKTSSFGPSSALNNPAARARSPYSRTQGTASDAVKNSLIANAALQRQQEARLRSLPDIDGVPTELALHLLNLHWNRQHHTFLLTYRPAIMRDLLTGGPNCSRFLLNAIFACVSKYSTRSPELRKDPNDDLTVGNHFFQRCEQLLAEERLLISPSIPTVVGLLLLGSTYNARGETSRAWLYTGYALRMVFDLALHLDPRDGKFSAEEAEIRRRVFWGAFICDKLQGLYLGRPTVINLRDAHVSQDFYDTLEEHEMWTPYPGISDQNTFLTHQSTSIYSVSTFKQLGLLSRIMERILNHFYVVGATCRNAKGRLGSIDQALQNWRRNLPVDLAWDPLESLKGAHGHHLRPPNVINMHAIYHSLIILLYRPFISDGHLRQTTAPEDSWRRCSVAARSITNLALAYRSAYTLQSAPYILSYAIYVACTIHVRNTAACRDDSRSLLDHSLQCLEQLCKANAGVQRPVSIIKRLMATYNIPQPPAVTEMPTFVSPNINSPVESNVRGSVDQSSLDLDAIFSMFPSQNTGMDGYDNFRMPDDISTMHDGSVMNNVSDTFMGGVQGFEFGNLGDALYGHMDGPIFPWQDTDEHAVLGNS